LPTGSKLTTMSVAVSITDTLFEPEFAT